MAAAAHGAGSVVRDIVVDLRLVGGGSGGSEVVGLCYSLVFWQFDSVECS